jgi:hypothetical protein
MFWQMNKHVFVMTVRFPAQTADFGEAHLNGEYVA